MTSDGIESDHMDQAKWYCVTLYQHATPDEFHWSENQTIGFLETRLSGLAEAQQVTRQYAEGFTTAGSQRGRAWHRAQRISFACEGAVTNG
jgi:hypothetical protein